MIVPDILSPAERITVLLAAVAATALTAYLIGRSNGQASHLEAVGSLKTSVASCATAAGEAKRLAEADAKDGADRERRIAQAVRDGINDAARIARQRSAVLQAPLRGDTECERTSNAITDHFRGGAAK